MRVFPAAIVLITKPCIDAISPLYQSEALDKDNTSGKTYITAILEFLPALDSSKAGVSSNADDVPEVSLEEMLDDLNLEDVDM